MTPSIRRVTFAVPLATMAVAAAVLHAGQQPIRSGARTVAVYATVSDKGGRLVPDLTAADFEIKDEGKVQPIAVFSKDPQPITAVVMLDRSGSMRGNFRLVEQAAQAFITRLEPADKARIGLFADRIRILPDEFTGDHARLMRIFGEDLPFTGASPVWNAVDESMAALREQPGRRVVVLFSDGADAPNFNFRNRSIMDVMSRAQRENVMVYAIGVQSTVILRRGGGGVGGMTGGMTSTRPDPSLSILAEDTGGGYFELNRGENLVDTFARVADELHHQYALGFEPTRLDDKMHTLEVRIKKSGMKARARKEYFAARP